jgi:WD40 repeat protein
VGSFILLLDQKMRKRAPSGAPSAPAKPLREERVHVATTASGGGMTVGQLENLFVQKLTEKYQLTARDMQRAFKRFDLDGSGLLTVTELTRAVHYFLNGIDASLIQQLVKRYDVDGDGEISLEEFCAFLLSRNAINKDEWLTVDHLTTDTRGNSRGKLAEREEEDDVRPATREFLYIDELDGTTMEYHARLFLHNVKSSLLKITHELRTEGKFSFQDRCGQHFNELAESKARVMLYKAFLPYTQGKKSTNVDYSSFKRVLNKFVSPGCAPPNEALIRFLFGACACAEPNRADPDLLVDMMFDKRSHEINKFGFTDVTKAVTDTGRPENGRGPFNRQAVDPPMNISDIPFRFITKKCKTSLATPTNFNLSLLRRSSQMPDFQCSRSHIFGLNSGLYSGDMIHSLSGPASDYSREGTVDLVAYSSAAVGIVHNISDNTQRYFDGHTDDITCVCVSPNKLLAATGQIGRAPEVLVWSTEQPEAAPTHRLGKGFFSRGVCAVEFTFDAQYLAAVSCDDKHTIGVWHLGSGQLLVEAPGANGVPPQIKCMKFSPSLVPTGFINREHGNTACDMLVTCGERHLKFWSFQRPRTRDNRGANLDNRIYRFGKFKVDAAKVFTCIGFTSAREHFSPDVTNNAGRMRPSSSGSGAVNAGGDESVGTSDVLTGGDSGVLYLWRGGLCVNGITITADGGSIDCLQVHKIAYGSDIVVCGGAGGIVCLLNAYSLEILNTYSVLASVAAAAKQPVESSTFTALFGAPPPPLKAVAKAGTVVVKPRPMSANRASRPRSGSSGNITTAKINALTSRAGDIAGAASGSLSKACGTKKLSVNAPKDAWVRPGLKEEKEVEQALEGVKGSSNVIGLTLCVQPGCSLSSIVAVTGFGKVVKIDVSVRGRPSRGLDNSTPSSMRTLFYFHYGPLWAVAVMDKPLNDVNAFVTGGDDRWLCMWDANNTAAGSDLLCRVKTTAPIRCLDTSTIFSADNGVSKTGNLIEMSVAVGSARGRLSIYIVTARRRPTLSDNSVSSLVRKHTAHIEYEIFSSAKRKDCAEDVRYADSTFLILLSMLHSL